MSDRKKKNKDTIKENFTLKYIRKMEREDGLRMKFVDSYTFRAFYENIEARYAKRPMYRVFRKDESAMTFGQFAHYVRSVGSYLLSHGYEKGDKVAIFGESCPNWMVMYVAVTSIGCIAVPILPDFIEREALTILEHSGAKGVCVLQKHFVKIHKYFEKSGCDLFRMEDLFHLPNSLGLPAEAREFALAPGYGMKEYAVAQKELDRRIPEEDDIASIIYTSGTTGSSKGVMLTHKNLMRDADLNTDTYIKANPKMRALSILPMSHVYEFTIGQVLVLLQGIEVVFLGKPPAVSILLPALKQERPDIILSVPLLIEKVYRSAVVPVIRDNPKMAKMVKNPLLSGFVHRVINKKIITTFGGKLKFFGVGGAPLDPEVEEFLYKAGFPYALGYGLTETSPFIAGCSPKKKDHKPGFVGKVTIDADVKLLDMNEEGVGEIAVRGPMVMNGYYGRDDLNAEVFTEDGYFKTGDLGYFDKDGMLAIKGRVKTMILGPAGENIYPELIENVINAQEFVQESLVVPSDGGLLALIKIDIEMMAKKMKIDINEAKDEAAKYVKSLRKTLNAQLSVHDRLDETELQDEEFERTPTMKIKRFLYPKKKAEAAEKDREDK